MIPVKTIIREYENTLDAAIRLQSQLGRLSEIVSSYLGEEVVADICGGNEIEFRRMKDGFVDAYSTMRLEDIIHKK